MNLPMAITIAVLLISILLYISGRVPYLAISLAAPMALYFCGIVTPADIFTHLTNEGLLMSVGMFLCGGALISSGAAERIGSVITRRFKSERSLMLCFFLAAVALSTFINNIAAAMVFIPLIMGIGQQGLAKPSRLLLPMAVGCSMGGVNSLIGQPLNILANIQLEEAGLEPFGFFEFARIGVPLCIAAAVYICLFGHRMLPERESTVDYVMPDRKRQSAAKQAVAAGVFLAVIVSMVLRDVTGIPMQISSLTGGAVLLFTGTMTDKEAISYIDFNGILMVVSMLTVANALSATGATTLLAEGIVGLFGAGSSPFLFCAILVILTAVLTNFISNTACCALFMPMGIALASALNCNHKAVAIAIVIGSSMAFATPVGTHCNTVVIGYGGYRYKDYVKFGLPVTVIWVVGACLLLPLLWKF
jgi:sodium-dependent dicarboxylate transporter 2/3/5